MPIPPPPLYDAFAVLANQVDQKPFPKLQPGFKWLRWLTDDVTPAIDKAPAREAHVPLANQSASLALTPLPLATVPPGIWQVSYWFKITTPGTVSSSLQFHLTYTRNGVVITDSGVAVITNTTSSHQFGTLPIRVDADTPISIATTYASAGAQPMLYELDVVAVALSLDSTA